MAGMLPGVELARRRRTHHHGACHHDVSPFTRASTSLIRHRMGPTAMDETALKARSRLQQKLGCFASRSSNTPDQTSEGGSSESSTASPALHRRSTPKEVKWQPRQWSRQNSQKEICSICLDEFKAQQGVLNLPCSHRYHSACLLPWLSVHSQCPYCRSQIPSP